ncbi:MAG: asparaginase domain-containing protein [Candidatus Thorarchaeota archaeon]
MNNVKPKYSKKLGFLLAYGTDTMSWALSAIRYMLKNLPANVAITGSQVPISMQYSSSDVYPNVETSIKLLTHLTGPDIFVVFNNGRAAFQDDLWKVDKWSPNAFTGEELATISLDELIIRGRSYPLNLNRKLDKLYLIRTGGTIESEQNEDGILTPTANLISSYISQRFTHFYDEFESIQLMSSDSSDLHLDSWKKICLKITEECQKTGYTTYTDEQFNSNVIVIDTTPFLKEDDYRTLFRNADGVILNAYGSGTINTDIASGHSPLPAIEEAINEGKTVILSSQTPFGTQDFVYFNAWEPIRKGAIPSGDFSVAHSQIKLAYILGHKKEMERFSKKFKIPIQTLIKIAFLSGVDFRSHASRKKFESLIGYSIPINDPFFNLPFEVALEKIFRYLDKKETQQLYINSIDQFEEIYHSYFSAPNQRSKWAIIIKPDTVIGANQWGELIDASKNFATITKEILDWNVVILELSEIKYMDFLESLNRLCEGESIGQFLRSFRYVIVEGGRQSLYDVNSFTDIASGNFEKKDYIHLLKSLMQSRNDPRSNPGLYLCLGHQGIAETIRDFIVQLISKSNDYYSLLSSEDTKIADEFQKILAKIELIGNEIVIKNRDDKIIANGFRDQYFAVKLNELPEIGLKKLVQYKPTKTIPSTLIASYNKISKIQTGLLEDFHSLESLDIIMLHNDEVNEEAILFFNWALYLLSNFIKKYYSIFTKYPELLELTKMPFGIEIPNSTLYTTGNEKDDYLTEIAGMVLYYYDYEANRVKRDYTLQFHPELFEEIRIMQKRDFESKTLLELSDGIKLLLSSLQAGYIETPYE